MKCLLPYLCMVTVPHIMVGLERMLDYRGVGLERMLDYRGVGLESMYISQLQRATVHSRAGDRLLPPN